MTGRGITLGRVLGFPIRIHVSWVVIVFLVTVSLAAQFQHDFPALGGASAISLGLSAALLLFGSVLAHELSHAVVARRHGVAINGITLFIFGGAAEMVEEPKRPRDELLIAIAGPLMSLFLAVVFGALRGAGLGLPPVAELAWRLSQMNFLLAAFNIVPGFPLDGGRVLRALLWGIWGRLSAATRVAAGAGSFFGTFLVLLGLFWLFTVNLGGLWFVLIGFFLRNAAQSSVQQLELQSALADVTARDLMTREGPRVRGTASLDEVVQDVMVPLGISAVPVVEGDAFLGMLRLEHIQARERGSWAFVTARDVMEPLEANPSIHPDDGATKVMAFLRTGGRDDDRDYTLPVVAEGKLVGLVSRDDVLRRLQMRLALGANPPGPGLAGDGDEAAAHREQHAGHHEGEEDLEGKHDEVSEAPERSREQFYRNRDERDEHSHERDPDRDHQREGDRGQDQ